MSTQKIKKTVEEKIVSLFSSMNEFIGLDWGGRRKRN